MKNFKTIFFILSLLLVAAGCSKTELEVSASFSKSVYELTVGDELDMISELVVKNTNQKPVFVSLNAKVASVSTNGKLTAMSAGEATITATVADKSAKCTVKVTDVAAGSITLTCPAEIIAGKDSWITISADVEAEGFNMDNLEWTFEPSVEDLEIDYKRNTKSEYLLCVKSYIENAKVKVTVSDRNSSASKAVEITVLEPEPDKVAATRLRLDYPGSLTEGEDIWGTVTVEVTPEDYDLENLVWDFTPSDQGLGFQYEKLGPDEYKISFSDYKKNGKVTIKVTDTVSGIFTQAVVNVDERPAEGTRVLTVSPNSLQLFADSEPVAVNVTTDPSDYDRALLKWTSSREDVVTVSDGVITVVGVGEAVIKVKDVISGLEDECNVTVKPSSSDAVVKRITLSETNLMLKFSGSSVQLEAKCYDDAGKEIENYSGLQWSVEKMTGEIGLIDIVEVTQTGVVTPKNIGSTVLTVSDKKNSAIKATCNVSVTGVLPTGITMTPASLVLPVDMLYEGFKVEIIPSDCDYKEVSWKSSDNEVAVVDGTGKVKTLKAGSVVISVSTKEGNHTAECKLTVKDSDFAISLELASEYNGGIPQGGSAVVTASYITPDGGTYTPSKTSWASSDESLAKVDEHGNVTVLHKEMTQDQESVTITHTADGEEASIDLKIIRALPESIQVTSYPENYKMYLGEEFRFEAAVNPSNADQTVKWACYTSADVAGGWRHIDMYTGLFKANLVGVFNITCFSGYEYRDDKGVLHMFDHIKTSFDVEVLPIMAESVSLNRTSLELVVGNTASLEVTFKPENTTYRDLQWTSSNDEVVEVSANGILTAKSSGDAVITVRQEENDVTLTCAVTVKERVKDYSIGDYYYSDGTISSELLNNKTVVGVVVSLNDITAHDSKLASDHPSCSNGLVLSLEDADAVKWQGYGASISNWAVNNGYASLCAARVEAGIAMGSVSYLVPQGEKLQGYNNTMAIKGYMARSDYGALGEDYAVHLFDSWNQSAPSGTSGWYVPSIAELLVVAENASLISQKMISAGGDSFDDNAGYWTSSENDGVGSWAVYINIMENKFFANNAKLNTHKVRYVFAF